VLSFVFAGIENNILQFDIMSMMDKHPDPVFKYGPKKTMSADTDVRRKWDPDRDVMRLAMYEQVPMGAMRLRVQAGVGDLMLAFPGGMRGGLTGGVLLEVHIEYG
jgi:hypothetical protein